MNEMVAKAGGRGRKASQRGSQEQGAARIQQLTEMFPEMPREMVVHADYVNEGIRKTAVIEEVGRWAIPDSHILYEYGKEHPLQEEVQAGYSLSPQMMYFGNGTPLQVMFDSDSPYEVRYEGRGCYWLYRDGEPIEEVHFPPCPPWFRKTTSSGTPMSSVMGLTADRALKLVPTSYCEFFRDGNQCRFCNINPTHEHFTELGQERALTKREQDIYETYLAAAAEKAVESVGVIGGSFYDRRKEADLHIRMYGALKRAMKDSGCVMSLGYIGQPQEEEDYLRLKEAGAISTNCPMEVWEPRLFPLVSPGKNKSLGGREHWIECLLRAREIFGKGRVLTSFVVGVEMAPGFGFKTEGEAAESVIAGFRFWASHGIVAGELPFRTGPGAILAGAPRPRVEYLLRMERERHNILKEYKLIQAGAGANLPRGQGGQAFAGDWMDAPEEALWPPALRNRAKESPVNLRAAQETAGGENLDCCV